MPGRVLVCFNSTWTESVQILCIERFEVIAQQSLSCHIELKNMACTSTFCELAYYISSLLVLHDRYTFMSKRVCRMSASSTAFTQICCCCFLFSFLSPPQRPKHSAADVMLHVRFASHQHFSRQYWRTAVQGLPPLSRTGRW